MKVNMLQTELSLEEQVTLKWFLFQLVLSVVVAATVAQKCEFMLCNPKTQSPHLFHRRMSFIEKVF